MALRPATLVLGTQNLDKLREFLALLAAWPVQVQSLADFPTIVEPVEHGATLEANAALKASYYATTLRQWILADDTGLEVAALGGAPGVLTARYAGNDATPAQNRAKLIAELAAVPVGRRTARFVCHLALADPTGDIRAISCGHCHGQIARELPPDDAPSAAGRRFGYDGLFELAEYHCTLAELGPAATAVVGHRGRAVQAMRPVIEPLLTEIVATAGEPLRG